jgi:hypothetical protein
MSQSRSLIALRDAVLARVCTNPTVVLHKIFFDITSAWFLVLVCLESMFGVWGAGPKDDPVLGSACVSWKCEGGRNHVQAFSPEKNAAA